MPAALLALIGVAIVLPATAAPRQQSVAIMPTQYFSADAGSAQNVTEGLVRQFESHGYTVIPMERAQAVFREMELSPNRHYADEVALRFGRRAGADLVAHSGLLSLGVPLRGGEERAGMRSLAAVVTVRVLNVSTGKPLYFRQIRHGFEASLTPGVPFVLPQPVATAAAAEVTRNYFERVAGTRQELGRPR
jgi:hypothetical protein